MLLCKTPPSLSQSLTITQIQHFVQLLATLALHVCQGSGLGYMLHYVYCFPVKVVTQFLLHF